MSIKLNHKTNWVAKRYSKPTSMHTGYTCSLVIIVILIHVYCISGPRRSRAKTFSDTSTRNMIEHLAADNGIIKDNQEGKKSQAGQRIEEAFQHGSHPRTIHFNKIIFKQLLIRWIIVSNISFRQVEISAFRFLLAYLCTCVCLYFYLFRRLSKSFLGSKIRDRIAGALSN